MVTMLRMLNELQIRILTMPLLIHESSSQPPSFVINNSMRQSTYIEKHLDTKLIYFGLL